MGAAPKHLRAPNAVWAWEFLRRNKEYRNDFRRHLDYLPKQFDLSSGSRLVIGDSRYAEARKWGLLFFSDPYLPASKAGVFWKPSKFPATIPVTLRNLEREQSRIRHRQTEACDLVVLSKLKCQRMMYESVNQSRHVVLMANRIWIQLYCDSNHPLEDNALIGFRIDGAKHANKRVKSMMELLRLHRSTGRKLAEIGTRQGSEKLNEAIQALDIKSKGGSYRDIARSIYGQASVNKSWSGGYSPLKQKARRALVRGRLYRDGKYLELLS